MAVNNAYLPTPPEQPGSPSGKKYFTIAQADSALPYVSRIVEDVMAVYEHVVELRRDLEQDPPVQGVYKIEAKYDASMDRLSALIDELHEVGVELKDFEKGLVDFPALQENREVSLCWKPGEEKIAHWHEVDAGFAGRHPISTLQG